MKKLHLLILTVSLAAVAMPSAALAGNKGAKRAKGGVTPEKKEERKAARQAARPFDSNKDGAIDGAERDELKKAFEANKTGPLKFYDANGNGQLDDSEIDGIKFHQRAKGVHNASGKPKKVGGKKNI